MKEELEKLLALFDRSYPSSIHEGIPVLRLHPGGSGEIWHSEMGAFSFKNLDELISHLTPDEEVKEHFKLKSPEHYLNTETGDVYIIWWTGNRPTGKDFVKISEKVYRDFVK